MILLSKLSLPLCVKYQNNNGFIVSYGCKDCAYDENLRFCIIHQKPPEKAFKDQTLDIKITNCVGLESKFLPVITSAKEVMFWLLWYVCLSVFAITPKVMNGSL